MMISSVKWVDLMCYQCIFTVCNTKATITEISSVRFSLSCTHSEVLQKCDYDFWPILLFFRQFFNRNISGLFVKFWFKQMTTLLTCVQGFCNILRSVTFVWCCCLVGSFFTLHSSGPAQKVHFCWKKNTIWQLFIWYRPLN